MTKSYNLRSSASKKNLSQHCYLKKLSEEKSTNAINPSVNLKRLNILERPCNWNRTFHVQGCNVAVKKPNSRSSSLVYLTLFIVVVFLLMSSLNYMKDGVLYNRQEVSKFIPNFQKHYNNFMQFFYNKKLGNIKTCVSDCLLKETKSGDKKNDIILNAFTNSGISCKKSVDLEIQKMVKEHIVQQKKKNKVSKRNGLSFIEEQCKMTDKSKFVDNYKKNLTDSDTAFDPESFIDYALESKGARIISTFDTKAYGAVAIKFLGYNIGPIQHFLFQEYINPKGPASILVPSKKPGDCWAFQGSSGRVQIELSDQITVTAISIDHLTKDLFPEANVQSAPKVFSVASVIDGKFSSKKIYLGTFKYEVPGPSVQTFSVRSKNSCKIIELTIESNHGNKEYTCLYKVRVHGYK